MKCFFPIYDDIADCYKVNLEFDLTRFMDICKNDNHKQMVNEFINTIDESLLVTTNKHFTKKQQFIKFPPLYFYSYITFVEIVEEEFRNNKWKAVQYLNKKDNAIFDKFKKIPGVFSGSVMDLNLEKINFSLKEIDYNLISKYKYIT